VYLKPKSRNVSIRSFFLFALSFLLGTCTAENVNLIYNKASLLSGGLADCPFPRAETCKGGVATAWAYARHYINTTGESVLYIPTFDRTSAFVQMHPLEWDVNHKVLNEHFGHKIFVSGLSLLTSLRDISLLLNKEMPLLASDAHVPPSSQWYFYTKIVYFDPETHLATIYFQSNAVNSWPKIDVAKNALDRIAKANEGMDENSRWIPLIIFDDLITDNFNQFLPAISDYLYPPAIILKSSGEVIEAYNPPKKFTDNTWVASFASSKKESHRVRITLGSNNLVQEVTLNVDNLEKLPSEMKDSKYVVDQKYLKKLASEATLSDPVVGTSKAMPLTRIDIGNTNTRMCYAGECIIGNLFTDAMRWKVGVDIAFQPSGGLRGPGWPAGDVRISDIWTAQPYANFLCTATLSGLTIFKILHYSTSVASFTSTFSDMGDRLMQVSGLRYTYNTKLKESRIIAVEVWDENSGQYLPLVSRKLYSVVADNFLCSIFDPFPTFFGSDIIEGEVPGVITEILQQSAVEEYLTQLGTAYNTTAQGRLVNNTSARVPLDFIQGESKCPADSFWSGSTQACSLCPVKRSKEYLTFSEDIMELTTQKGQNAKGRAVLTNRNIVDVGILIKSPPEWAQFTNSTAPGILQGNEHTLHAGKSIAFDLLVNTTNLEGLMQAPVTFTVKGSTETSALCALSSTEISFGLSILVVPPPQKNHLSTHIRISGLAVMVMIILTSLAFAIWVVYYRENKVVRSSQPIFLLLICCGTLVMSTAILPLSIDDKIVSVRGCDISCMAMPWLLSVGFVLTFSALFSKILKVNTIVRASLRLDRIELSLLDVLKPLVALSLINIVLLLIWTLVDPLKWVRSAAEETNKSWNTYGACRPEGKAGYIFIILIMLIDFGSLVMTLVQAYQAREIRDGISESKYIGIAAVSWLEVFLITAPLLGLVKGNPTASYFLWLAIIFVMCMSMLLLIFVPKIMMMRDSKSEEVPRNESIFRRSSKQHRGSSNC